MTTTPESPSPPLPTPTMSRPAGSAGSSNDTSSQSAPRTSPTSPTSETTGSANPQSKPSAPASDPNIFKRELLEAAIAAVCGDRALNYGKPEANFARIATLWNAYVYIRKQDMVNIGQTEEFELSEWDVANIMILMKVARLMHQPNHKDSWIDIAGYAACGYDITHD